MSGPELIVDNSEEICFPVPHLWRDHENGLVLVQFQCGTCGETGAAFQGPKSAFVALKSLAESYFLSENACALAAKPAQPAAADDEGEAEADDIDEEVVVERRHGDDLPEIQNWESSFDHDPGDVLQKFARELPPSVIVYALYNRLLDEEVPFAREWAETFGPGWGMMGDDEKPRLQKMTGMLVAEMGSILAVEERLHRRKHAWATPLENRLEELATYVADGLHTALSVDRERPVAGDTPYKTLAMLAARMFTFDAAHPQLVDRLRSAFEDHPLELLLDDVPEEGSLSEDQLEKLALAVAIDASFWSFIEPLQRRVEGELRRHRTVVG